MAGNAGSPALTVPWELVAESYRTNRLAFEERGFAEPAPPTDPNGPRSRNVRDRAYVYQPGATIALPAPSTPAQGTPTGKDAEWAQWRDSRREVIGRTPIHMSEGMVVLNLPRDREGLFRCTDPAALPSEHAGWSALALSQWKRDLLAFCQRNKTAIELNRDPELIRASIALAHWDHLLEGISASAFLSPDLLEALARAVENRQAFDRGERFLLVEGVNRLRLRRFPGASIEEFVVSIPGGRDDVHSRPVCVHTDNLRWATAETYAAVSDQVEIWWHTVTDRDPDWKGLQALMGVVSDTIPVDPNRIYVHGVCGNGRAAMALALNHPDYWAECGTSLTSTYRYLAGNALNLPLVFVKDRYEDPGSLAYYDFACNCFRFNECRFLKTGLTETIEQARGKMAPFALRERAPGRVSYTLESLRNPGAYWVDVGGREDENLIASIEAAVVGQRVELTTDNIRSFALNLAEAPLDAGRTVEIVVNGCPLEPTREALFVYPREDPPKHRRRKTSAVHGPIADVFSDRYRVVYGTGADAKTNRILREIATKLARGAPCLADHQVSEAMLKRDNLVLVGTEASNRIVSLCGARLPARIQQGRVTGPAGWTLDGDAGCMVVHPNPWNPNRYVALFSATSDTAMRVMNEAFAELTSFRPADVAIYQVGLQDAIEWRIQEKLDTYWQWHADYSVVLDTLDRHYSKWQWKQWIAAILKNELEADVAVCEEIFRDYGALAPGVKTYRDIFNAFENEWFVKVRLEGKALKALLRSPFDGLAERQVREPVIEGVRLVPSSGSSPDRALRLEDIVADRHYTVVLPESYLNSFRLGVIVPDYEITAQAYLLALLKQYLLRNGTVDFDAQLGALVPVYF